MHKCPSRSRQGQLKKSRFIQQSIKQQPANKEKGKEKETEELTPEEVEEKKRKEEAERSKESTVTAPWDAHGLEGSFQVNKK